MDIFRGTLKRIVVDLTFRRISDFSDRSMGNLRLKTVELPRYVH